MSSVTDKRLDILFTRVERAAAHREELWAIATEYLKANPITSSIDHRENECVVMMKASAPFPPSLSVIFGEWLYNLRSAFDGLMYELAVNDTEQDPPPRAGKLFFPTTRSAEDFAKLNLGMLSKRTRAVIESTQPYHSTGGYRGSALWWINELSRLDRHRRGHLLVWHLQVHVSSSVGDERSSRVCDEWKAFIRDDEDLEAASIGFLPNISIDSNDGVDITRTVQLDIPEWVQGAVPSYGVWPLDDRMANAELVTHTTLSVICDQIFG